MRAQEYKAVFPLLILGAMMIACGKGISSLQGDSLPKPVDANNRVFARYAFVANSGENTVSTFAVDAATGSLQPQRFIATGAKPVALAMTPHNEFVYVINQESNDISAYRVDNSTGILTPLPDCVDSGDVNASVKCSAAHRFATGASPIALMLDRAGKFAFVINAGDATLGAYRIDTQNGKLYSVGPAISTGAGTAPKKMAIDSAGLHLYIANGNNSIGVWSVAADGKLQALSGSPVTIGGTTTVINDIALSADGKYLYAADQASGTVASLPLLNSGAVGEQLSAPFVTTLAHADSVAVEPQGKRLLVTDASSGECVTMPISANGTLGVAGSKRETGAVPGEFNFDPSGDFAYVTSAQENEIRAFRLQDGVPNYLNGLAKNSRFGARMGPARRLVFSQGQALKAVTNFAVTANGLDKSLSLNVIDSMTHELKRAGSDVTLADAMTPKKVVVTPNGKFIYAITDSQIQGFVKNGGEMTAMAGVPFACAVSPEICESAVMDLEGKNLYVLSNTSSVIAVPVPIGPIIRLFTFRQFITRYAINPENGALVADPKLEVGTPTLVPQAVIKVLRYGDVAIDASGALLIVTGALSGKVKLISIATDGTIKFNSEVDGSDTATGALQPSAVAIDPAGRYVYAANYASNDVAIYALSRAGTGALSLVPCPTPGTPPCSAKGNFTAPSVSAPSAITVDRLGNVYVTNSDKSTITVLAADATTPGALGAELPGSPFPSGANPSSLTFDFSGQYLYATNGADDPLGNSVMAWRLGGDPNWLTALPNVPFPAAKGPVSMAISGGYQ